MIDRASASKLILQLPPSACTGLISDIAVIPTRIVVVGPDGSVTVFAVPLTWDSDDTTCEMILHIKPDSSELDQRNDVDDDEFQQGIGRVTKAEWVRREGINWLAVGGTKGVILICPSAYNGQLTVEMSDVTQQSKVLRTDGVCHQIAVQTAD